MGEGSGEVHLEVRHCLLHSSGMVVRKLAHLNERKFYLLRILTLIIIPQALASQQHGCARLGASHAGRRSLYISAHARHPLLRRSRRQGHALRPCGIILLLLFHVVFFVHCGLSGFTDHCNCIYSNDSVFYGDSDGGI